MDQIKIGKFIAQTRRSLSLTQAQLAERLGVSDKSVSKWERGVCLPDPSLYFPLCEALGITVSEFFAGEHLPEPETALKRSEESLVTVSLEGKKRQGIWKRAALGLALFLVSMTIGLGLSLSSSGYFLHEYITAVPPGDEETALYGMLSGSAFPVQLFRFDSLRQRSAVVSATQYSGGQAMEPMEFTLGDPSGAKSLGQGLIVCQLQADGVLLGGEARGAWMSAKIPLEETGLSGSAAEDWADGQKPVYFSDDQDIPLYAVYTSDGGQLNATSPGEALARPDLFLQNAVIISIRFSPGDPAIPLEKDPPGTMELLALLFDVLVVAEFVALLCCILWLLFFRSRPHGRPDGADSAVRLLKPMSFLRNPDSRPRQ